MDAVADDPDLARHRGHREAVVAGDDDHPDTRLAARGDRRNDLPAWRVLKRSEPDERQLGLGPGAFTGLLAGDPALGEAEDAQPGLRVPADGVGDGLAVGGRELAVAVRSADGRAEIEQLERRALRVQPQGAAGLRVGSRHALDPRVEAEDLQAVGLAAPEQPLDVRP